MIRLGGCGLGRRVLFEGVVRGGLGRRADADMPQAAAGTPPMDPAAAYGVLGA
jgi:hypothetical protein